MLCRPSCVGSAHTPWAAPPSGAWEGWRRRRMGDGRYEYVARFDVGVAVAVAQRWPTQGGGSVAAAVRRFTFVVRMPFVRFQLHCVAVTSLLHTKRRDGPGSDRCSDAAPHHAWQTTVGTASQRVGRQTPSHAKARRGAAWPWLGVRRPRRRADHVREWVRCSWRNQAGLAINEQARLVKAMPFKLSTRVRPTGSFVRAAFAGWTRAGVGAGASL